MDEWGWGGADGLEAPDGGGYDRRAAFVGGGSLDRAQAIMIEPIKLSQAHSLALPLFCLSALNTTPPRPAPLYRRVCGFLSRCVLSSPFWFYLADDKPWGAVTHAEQDGSVPGQHFQMAPAPGQAAQLWMPQHQGEASPWLNGAQSSMAAGVSPAVYQQHGGQHIVMMPGGQPHWQQVHAGATPKDNGAQVGNHTFVCITSVLSHLIRSPSPLPPYAHMGRGGNSAPSNVFLLPPRELFQM